MADSKPGLDCLYALVEDLLHVGHRQTLVREVLRVIVVVELAGATLLVVVEGVIVSEAPVIFVLIVGVPGLLVAGVRVLMITHAEIAELN